MAVAPPSRPLDTTERGGDPPSFVGHTDAQRVLDGVRPAMVAAVEDSAGRTLAGMAPFAPLVDVLSADHERAGRRLFVS